MSLLSGSSKHIISENIRPEMHAGRPQPQAIAIAMSKASKGRKKSKAKKAAPKSPEEVQSKDEY